MAKLKGTDPFATVNLDRTPEQTTPPPATTEQRPTSSPEQAPAPSASPATERKAKTAPAKPLAPSRDDFDRLHVDVAPEDTAGLDQWRTELRRTLGRKPSKADLVRAMLRVVMADDDLRSRVVSVLGGDTTTEA